MKNASRTLMILAATVALAGSAFAAKGWQTDFEKAKQLAVKQGRPILVDFSGSDWCHWCIKLDKEVLSQKPFQEYAKQNLVLFLADFPRQAEQPAALKTQNEALAKQYKVEGFPTLLLLDQAGKEVARTGYQPGGPEKYVEHVQSLISKAQEKGKLKLVKAEGAGAVSGCPAGCNCAKCQAKKAAAAVTSGDAKACGANCACAKCEAKKAKEASAAALEQGAGGCSTCGVAPAAVQQTAATADTK